MSTSGCITFNISCQCTHVVWTIICSVSLHLFSLFLLPPIGPLFLLNTPYPPFSFPLTLFLSLFHSSSCLPFPIPPYTFPQFLLLLSVSFPHVLYLSFSSLIVPLLLSPFLFYFSSPSFFFFPFCPSHPPRMATPTPNPFPLPLSLPQFSSREDKAGKASQVEFDPKINGIRLAPKRLQKRPSGGHLCDQD